MIENKEKGLGQQKGIELIRFKALNALLGGVSRSTLFRWERDGKFPRHFNIGGNSIAWNLSEIEAWIGQRSNQGCHE